jgi:hypothetical protein
LTPISPVALSTAEQSTSGKAEKTGKVEVLHSVKVKGDSAIKEIVLCNTGESFAVSCRCH